MGTLCLSFLRRVRTQRQKIRTDSYLHHSHACAKLSTSAAIRSRHSTADVEGQQRSSLPSAESSLSLIAAGDDSVSGTEGRTAFMENRKPSFQRQ
jgi:hypothetical protein